MEKSLINFLMLKNENIPNEGWKIHISSKVENYQKTLNLVSEYHFLIQKKQI